MAAAIALDLLVTIIILRRLHSTKTLQSIHKHSLLLFNLLIFIFCSVLIHMEISIGAGVGLFAVLAMLRFRSEVLPIEELIYLLMFIGLGFTHAAMPNILSVGQVIFMDALFLALAFTAAPRNHKARTLKVRIDDLALLHPENRSYLSEVLEAKTGHQVESVEVMCLNLKDEEANLSVRLSNDFASQPKGNHLQISKRENGVSKVMPEQRPRPVKVMY